jgi:cardiolipin synthase A/B
VCASGVGRASSGLGPLITEPDQGYTPIYNLLGSAKKSLDLTMYEFRDSDAEKALIDDAARGVAVRVLLDKQYHGGPYNQPLFDDLVKHGIKVEWASTQVAITHQKSFVIDAKKAVIMTGNLTSPYYATSRDFAVVDTKKSDVNAIEATFALDWANNKGTAPTGADLVWSPGSQAQLVALIGSAKHSLLVENEEMAAPLIVSALEDAAKRGVTVQVVMTNSPSWKTNFDALKAAGVQVRTYKNSSKTLYIHAKIIESDTSRVFLGSENFSVGSLQHNRELGLITTSKPILQAINTTFVSDYAAATPW